MKNRTNTVILHALWKAGGCLAAALLLASSAFAQIINTIAGNAINDGRPPLQTTLVQPYGIAFDPQGNLVIADSGNFVVRRVSTSMGISSVLAGTGGNYCDDAIPIPGKSAGLDFPVFLAIDANGDIYFSDFNDYKIRKITPVGLVTSVAGRCSYGYSGDGGRATLAELSVPAGVALDRVGNLYIADLGNSVVRRINLSTGIIQTYAGTGTSGYSGDGGQALQAQLDGPYGLAIDAAGNLYISDINQDVIRKVSPTGIITTEVPKSAGLSGPKGLALDSQGRLYVVDSYNDRVVRVGPGGTLTVVAGGGDYGFPRENVPATSTYLLDPFALAFDSAGNLFISEEGWNLVRRVDASTGQIRTAAGTLDVQDGSPAISAPLAYPNGIAIDGTGNIYITDRGHQRIRKIPASTNPAQSPIQTVIGTGLYDSAPDGTLASGAPTADPWSVSVDSRGNLYFPEAYSVIRKIDASTGRLSTVAGTLYNYGYAGDGGPANSALLDGPSMAVADSVGNVYISDTFNHCIRHVNPAGIIRTAAGACTKSGYSGDGGTAIQARLDSPTGLAFDRNGNLLIADSYNHVVRRLILATGIIERVAGKGGVYDYTGDNGPPLEATLANPVGLAVDFSGNIYISDSDVSAVRMIRGNTITTIAGVGFGGFAGDGGEAIYAFLNSPRGLALDSAGNLYIVDTWNNRIRRVSGVTQVPVTSLSVEPLSLSFRVAQGATPPAPQSLLIKNVGSGSLFWSAAASTSSGGGWLRLSANAGSTPSSFNVIVETANLAAGTYQGTIRVTSTGAANSPVTISVFLTVEQPITSSLELYPQFLNYEAVQGGAPPSSQILTIVNNGSTDLNWGTQVLTPRGGSWLSILPPSGTTRSGGGTSTAVVSVNPQGLGQANYLGQISVVNLSTGISKSVSTLLQVGGPASRILLTQSSFVFTVAQGSSAVPSQPFRVINEGQGAMSWQILTSGGGDWLRVTPQSGTSDAAAPASSPTVTLAVDPTQLGPGTYGSLLTISAPGARNTPQYVNVLVQVLSPGAAPVTQVLPTGLLFTANTAGSPVAQEINVQTSGGGTVTFTAGARTQDGGAWLTVSPTSGSLVSAAERTRVRVQVVPGTLPAGVYQGAVTFSFSDGSVKEVAVAAVLRHPTTAIAASSGKDPTQACAPVSQVLVSTRLANNFSLPTGWPVPMAVRINNNCGDPVANSTVAASFSNGDPPIVLNNLRDGQYTGNWTPARTPPPAAPEVLVSLRSLNPQLQEATIQLTGALGLDITNPVVNDNGIVNAASSAGFKPLSPGGIFSLYGANLAAPGACYGGFCVEGWPIPTTLGGVSVKIGVFDAPLFFAGPGQINGQIPAELGTATSAAVVVTARGIVSSQRTIQLDTTQPGIFAINQQGTGQGAILNQDYSANSSANPAARGSVVQVFATGLGPTDPPVASGTAAPSTPPFATVTNSVTVTLGGLNAPVQFQALAPGFVGLYQINVQVPEGVTSSSAVPLKITQNGIESNEVTVAIR